MHPLAAKAWTFAGEQAHCDAALEPVLEGLRRALLDSGVPAAADMARLGELLQLSLLIAQRTQDAVVRGLRWAEQARATVGRKPRARVGAVLSSGLQVALASEDLEPLVWEYQGHPLNTLLYLRADEFLSRAEPHHEQEHWVVQQARYQACGVLSGALTHLWTALRAVADIELEDCVVYRRDGQGLALEVSPRSLRAGLWLRTESSRLQTLLVRADDELQAALVRIGVADKKRWAELTEQAARDNVELRSLVRQLGSALATRAQLKAAIEAGQRYQTAYLAAQDAQDAARELRKLRPAGAVPRAL